MEGFKIKKRFKIISIFLAVILSGFILYYIGFLAPYNLQGMTRINIQSFKESGELYGYFKNYTVNNVKYLGRDSYEIFTDEGEFIVIANYSDSMYWKYKIFKYDKEYQYFTNPM